MSCTLMVLITQNLFAVHPQFAFPSDIRVDKASSSRRITTKGKCVVLSSSPGNYWFNRILHFHSRLMITTKFMSWDIHNLDGYHGNGIQQGCRHSPGKLLRWYNCGSKDTVDLMKNPNNNEEFQWAELLKNGAGISGLEGEDGMEDTLERQTCLETSTLKR